MDRSRRQEPSQQLALPLPTPTLPCAFGETGEDWDGPHHCAACHAEVERAVAVMAAARARGAYDAESYTPAERRAQARRKGERWID